MICENEASATGPVCWLWLSLVLGSGCASGVEAAAPLSAGFACCCRRLSHVFSLFTKNDLDRKKKVRAKRQRALRRAAGEDVDDEPEDEKPWWQVKPSLVNSGKAKGKLSPIEQPQPIRRASRTINLRSAVDRSQSSSDEEPHQGVERKSGRYDGDTPRVAEKKNWDADELDVKDEMMWSPTKKTKSVNLPHDLAVDHFCLAPALSWFACVTMIFAPQAKPPALSQNLQAPGTLSPYT
eukprot:gene8755-28_t